MSARVALVLPSLTASGTERRIGYVFKHLDRRAPGRHRLVLSREVFAALERAGFGLGAYPNVHVLRSRAFLDWKRGAEAPITSNLGRSLTLLRYRAELRDLLPSWKVDTLQAFLEMVPILGLFPIPGVRHIASLVSHLPKYYDPRSPHSRLLLLSLRGYHQIDALYPWIAARLRALGVPGQKTSHPEWNCVDTERFHPEGKQALVTFVARALAFKNPRLMLDSIGPVHREFPRVRFWILGAGPLQRPLAQEARRRGWHEWVQVGFLDDPSPVLNRSLIHVSIEQFDNATNQSLLEGMAAGCAIVASDVGLTPDAVPPSIGRLVPLEAPRIADALLELLRHPETARSMGSAARQLALDRHHVSAYLDYLDRLYDAPIAPAA